MKQYLLLCASMFLGLTACSSGNNNEETNEQVVSKKQIIFNQSNNEESFYDDSNVEFKDGKYTFSGGSCKIKNEISLPLFESSSWEISFKKLTIKSGHVLSFNSDDPSNKIYFTFNSNNKSISIGVSNNKKQLRFFNYGFTLPIQEFTDIDCSIKYENELFSFYMNDTEYKLNAFNVNQDNNFNKCDEINLSKELRAQIIGITNSQYLFLDSVGSLTNDAHLFRGSFEEISVSYSYEKEKFIDEISVLDDKSLFFLGSSIFYGHCTGGYSFADMISDHYLLTKVYKETVSGTTLAVSNSSKNSYVERMDAKIENSKSHSYIEDDDVLIVQLSTNDFSKGISLGNIEDEDVKDSESFDKTTITGAIEYICARARELNPDIKIVFISCPIIDSWAYRAKYKTYNDGIMQDLIQKWDINYLDLLNYEPAASSYVSLDASSLKGFFYDEIHPNFVGYSVLIYPLLVDLLTNIL